MTLAQISCFMEVAKYQRFSKAAEHLYISQPAVSKQVSLLEKSLDLVLIDRSYGSAQLTEAGKMLYNFFRKAEGDFNKITEEARRIARGHTGDLRLGCLDGWDLSTFYPELRGLLVEKYPNLHVNLDGYNHLHILDALRSKEIDIAITLEIALHSQPDVSRRNVTSAPVVMLFSTLHPLASKPDLTLADFRNDPFYVIAPSTGGENRSDARSAGSRSYTSRSLGCAPKTWRAAASFPSSTRSNRPTQNGSSKKTVSVTETITLPPVPSLHFFAESGRPHRRGGLLTAARAASGLPAGSCFSFRSDMRSIAQSAARCKPAAHL